MPGSSGKGFIKILKLYDELQVMLADVSFNQAFAIEQLNKVLNKLARCVSNIYYLCCYHESCPRVYYWYQSWFENIAQGLDYNELARFESIPHA